MSERPQPPSISDDPIEVRDGLGDATATTPQRTPDETHAESIEGTSSSVIGAVDAPRKVTSASRLANTWSRVRLGARSLLEPPKEQHPLISLVQAAILFGLLGMAIGSYVWWVGHWDDYGKHATGNNLPIKTRVLMFKHYVLGAIASTLLSGLWQLIRGGSIEHWRRVAMRLSPGILLGMVPVIFTRPTWTTRELPGLLLILCSGLGMERAMRASVAVGPCILPERLRTQIDYRVGKFLSLSWPPLAVVVATSMGYAYFFSKFAMRIFYRLGSRAFDLGIENNLVWNASTFSAPLFKTSPLGGPTSVHTGYHQTFFSYLIAIPYKLYPQPEFLLTLQAVFVGAAAIPLFIWLRRRLNPWLAALVAIAYLLYPPVHGGNLYDFHYQPLGPFFVWTALLFLERGRWLPGIVFVILTLSLREDMSLMLAVIGVFLAFSRQQVVGGAVLTVVSGIVFIAQKIIIMPIFLNGIEGYIHQYVGLVAPGDRGFAGVIKTVIMNQAFTLNSLLEQLKVTYSLHIFAPLLLLPLRRPLGWWLCLPGFFFTLLSTQYPPLVQIGFQYTTYWSMFVFLAAGWALSNMNQVNRFSAASGLAWTISAATWVYGGWVQPEGARGAWDVHHYELTPEDHKRHKQAYALIEMIPPDARVSASEFINAQVSSRANAYSLRGSLYDAEYLLLHTAAMGPREKQLVLPAVERKEFGLVARKEKFLLLKKGHDPSKNADILHLLK
jgi:uncharacterized membrane protein